MNTRKRDAMEKQIKEKQKRKKNKTSKRKILNTNIQEIFAKLKKSLRSSERNFYKTMKMRTNSQT
jgi:hypothetical protein